MNAIIIGMVTGLAAILTINLLKQFSTSLVYALVLSGIGYLYVGFNWSDTLLLAICTVQSVIFLLIACYGAQRSMLILASGYFLHGIWDLLFDLFPNTGLMPPHYDLFCLTIDFTMGIYLVILHYRAEKTVSSL
ncbi:hypothetical protein FFF34_002660 [Inquilinus sp. KBS0705]|nr:hypothetical protein FFF34_002660 [Inquilinus sp. KBS0705]